MILAVPVLSIMILSGLQVLMQHLLAVKGAQAPGDLLDDPAHGFQIRLRIVDHPLRQGLSVDEFRRDVEVVALSLECRQGFKTCGLSIRRATHSSIMKRFR